MEGPNAATALAVVLVDELARHGMVDAVVAPGSRSAPLAMALHADERVRVHVRIDERSASFLALGLAKASGRPVAVVCTSGSAAANLHPAVLEADLGGVPLLVLTADRPPELRGTGANQTIEQVGLYGRAVRLAVDVGVPEQRPGMVAYWRSLASRAVGEATGALGGPAGPVHLNLPLREPLVPLPDRPHPEPLDGRPGGAPWAAVTRHPRPPGPEDVEALAEVVTATERGLLVIGDTTAEPGPLLAMAEAASWPVIAEPHSGARTGPLAISTAEWLLRHPAFALAQRPDLVVIVGRAVLGKGLSTWLDADVPQIAIDADGRWLDPQRSVSRVVAADPDLLADAVVDDVLARGGSTWLDTWRDAEARGRAAVDAVLDADDAPTEARTARDLAALAPAGATLVVASSMPIRHLHATMRPRDRLRVLANRGASGIDGFVSTAAGVALASRGPTLALAGDLSLLHDANGLIRGAGPRPDLVLVVLNNDGGGIFSFLPQAGFPDGFEDLFGTPHGVDLAALARATGTPHTVLERASDLRAVGAAAQQAGGVQLVEVRTRRADTVALNRRLADAVIAALGHGDAGA